jgi:hypothetical protein
MDTTRLSQGQMVAAVSAGLLFIFMFLPWLGFDVPQGTVLEGVDTTANAWQATQSLDIFLFIVILSAVIPAFLAMSGSVAQLPFVGATTTFLLAVLGLMLLLALIVDPGEQFGLSLDLKIGLWLSVLATGGIAVGGYLAMQDEAYGGPAAAPTDHF